jgi:Na+/alanine symporter
MDILQQALMIAGLGALGALWVFAIMGMLQVGWESLLGPLSQIIRDRNSRDEEGDGR